MLTPTFTCTQDGRYVIVSVVLSAICKVMEAVFDICGNQFTLYCKPYYLRLRFNQMLCEGSGERATYNVETETLTVYLPKAVREENFDSLDNPAFLIATEKQRERMRRLVECVGPEGNEGDTDDDETEFVQELRQCASAPSSADLVLEKGEDESTEKASYGFANAFSGLFSKLDADLVSEVVDVKAPDSTPAASRRIMRVAKENEDFNLDAVLCSLDDADGEINRLLHDYCPAHICDFRQALAKENVVYAQAVSERNRNEAFEEEGEKQMGGDAVGEIWRGNVCDFHRPVVEISADGSSSALPTTAPIILLSSSATAAPLTFASMSSLAIPRNRPVLEFTRAETDTLMRLKAPALLFPPSRLHVAALTTDLLLSEAYDDLFTEGQGCCESVWTLCKLSPSLSYLDPPDTVYDACFYFARRLMVYPLHRHMGVFARIMSFVGTRMILGARYVVRALLRMRSILSHSECKHLLCTIFIDPLLAYWTNCVEGDSTLLQMALEIHHHAKREAPEVVKSSMPHSPEGVEGLLARKSRTVTLKPFTFNNLEFPLIDSEEA